LGSAAGGRLRPPVEKALGFLVRSRAVDGLAWRYAPGAPAGDTSILGWAVMALKSGRTVDVPIPTSTQAGILGWLKKVHMAHLALDLLLNRKKRFCCRSAAGTATVDGHTTYRRGDTFI